MKNIAPTGSLTRRSNQLKTLAFIVLALGIFIAALGVFLNVVQLVPRSSSSHGAYLFVAQLILIVGVITILIAIALFIRAFTWKTDNDLAQITARVLASALDDRFVFIRNVSKREIGYVDAVLIGPPGALVFRILDATGIFFNEGANWLQSRSGELVPARIDPTRECVADIQKMRDALQKRIGEIPVFGIVVFTKDPRDVQLNVKEPVVPITHLTALVQSIQGNYLAVDRIPPQQVEPIRKYLMGE
ncbi:NERD domain-containing protein [Anaerolineae bacterium CFX9]|nr:NERD domain-containing protein [Anaerolineae bacterium CFX9]